MTDEQLQQALDDPQMRELVEQMAFAKRTFKNEELQAEEPDVEGEWEKFAADHYGEDNNGKTNFSLFALHSSLQKIAASFVGVLLVSGMAFAAIHIVRMVNNQKAEDTTDTVQPVVFDNVPLEKMLTEIAAYYHAEVSFLNDDARQLRFHFVWKREDGLRHAIDKLNRFESLSVRLDENKIIVE